MRPDQPSPRDQVAVSSVGALSGLRVVDMTARLPGPLATLLLADYGADVIKVEGPRHPDLSRETGPFTDGQVSYKFGMLNRNKRAITIDLKTDGGRDALLAVLDSADVLVEGFRPGVADRLGLGYAALARRNPRLVYCSLSGYGQFGPYAQRPGHDLNYLSATGLGTYLNRPLDSHDRPFAKPWLPIADIGGGTMSAVFGILAAVLARQATGRGDWIDASVFDGLFFWFNARIHEFLADGTVPSPDPLRATGAMPGYDIYLARDDKPISLGCVESVFWRNLLAALELSDELPAQQPLDEAAHASRQAIATRIATRDRGEWLAVFAAHDVPASAVLTLPEVPDDPHVRARNLIIDTDLGDGVHRHLGFPVKLQHRPPALRRRAPGRGEHTTEVLKEAGLSDEQIEALRADGCIT